MDTKKLRTELGAAAEHLLKLREIVNGETEKPGNDKEYVTTSEDGVKLYDGDMCYLVKSYERHWDFFGGNKNYISDVKQQIANMGSEKHRYKVFRTKESAQRFIDEQNATKNEPKFTEGEYAAILVGGTTIYKLGKIESLYKSEQGIEFAQLSFWDSAYCMRPLSELKKVTIHD